MVSRVSKKAPRRVEPRDGERNSSWPYFAALQFNTGLPSFRTTGASTFGARPSFWNGECFSPVTILPPSARPRTELFFHFRFDFAIKVRDNGWVGKSGFADRPRNDRNWGSCLCAY